MSMITASAWVPRGYAAAFPTKYVFDDDEYGRIAKLAKLQLDDANEDLEEAREESGGVKLPGASASTSSGTKTKKSTNLNSEEDQDDDLAEYGLDKYDDAPSSAEEDGEEEEEDGHDDPTNVMSMFSGVKALAYHDSNENDPYITLPDNEEDDEEREELQILPGDNCILAARVEDEVAHLEVYVYEDSEDNLYVHHDIMLPDIPLCVEWLDFAVNKPEIQDGYTANFVAVGTMSPDIEVWDLDVVDCMYPNAVLGEGANDKDAATLKKKKKKNKSKKPNDQWHVDAVLSLAGNRKARNLLASSSADTTIKLWDLNTTKCAQSYTYHTDKVSSVAWHPQETTALLSGSYDRTIVVADMRAPNATAPRWGVESDVESVRWDPHNAHHFFAATENGLIHYYDARNAPKDPSKTKALWSLQAHDESISSFDVNPIIPGYLVTGSTDKQTKLWNIPAAGSGGPSMVTSRDVGVGRVFSTSFAPDKEVGFRLAVAGSKGALQIWDTSTNAAVRRTFADKVASGEDGEEIKERLVGLDEDETDSDSEEGEDVPEIEGTGHGEDGWEDDEEGAMEE